MFGVFVLSCQARYRKGGSRRVTNPQHINAVNINEKFSCCLMLKSETISSVKGQLTGYGILLGRQKQGIWCLTLEPFLVACLLLSTKANMQHLINFHGFHKIVPHITVHRSGSQKPTKDVIITAECGPLYPVVRGSLPTQLAPSMSNHGRIPGPAFNEGIRRESVSLYVLSNSPQQLDVKASSATPTSR